MKVFWIISFFCASWTTGYSQGTITRLASKLTSDTESEYNKVKKIYDWVTAHIEYDIKQLKDFTDFERAQSAEVVFTSKKAVCQGYANLMNALMDEAQITNYVIRGDARTDTDDGLQLHSWNAMSIDGQWHLIDATWDAGYIRDKTFVRRQSTDFFLQQPDQFIRTHLPDDPIWQLLPNPISVKNFHQKNFDSIVLDHQTVRDSIHKYISLPEEERSIASAYRQLNYNPDSFIGFYDLGIAYFEQANILGKTYEETTLSLDTKKQWRENKITLEKLLTGQSQLLRMSFDNFEALKVKSKDFRNTAEKNLKIIKSVQRNIKNELRLLHDL